MLIDFIYDEGCPNIELARYNLTQALEQLGLPAHWQEFESSQADLPDYARGFGSPSILVDAKDVAGEQSGSAPSCRLYSHGGPSGAPSVSQICRALDDFAATPASATPLKIS